MKDDYPMSAYNIGKLTRWGYYVSIRLHEDGSIYYGKEDFFQRAWKNWYRSIYMHKDGSIHNICGEGNYWKTYKDAENAIKRKFKITDKLPDELFEI